jgi:hypothetical protein
VPDKFGDEAGLVGPKARIAEQPGAFHDADVTTPLVSGRKPEALRVVAQLAL